jgi:hypothetical protein
LVQNKAVQTSPSAEKFKPLAGLPGYGELPEQFSATGMGEHSEGYVVQFFPSDNQNPWIGNFQRGLTRLDAALDHPDGSAVIVIAGGECYVVDADNRTLRENFGGMFETVIPVPDKNVLIFGSSVDFEAVGASGRIWRSRRISWDGIRSLRLSGETLMGEAWDLNDKWVPFSLDINSGHHEGGTYLE